MRHKCHIYATYKIHCHLQDPLHPRYCNRCNSYIECVDEIRPHWRCRSAPNIALIQCRTKKNDILISHTFSFNGTTGVKVVFIFVEYYLPTSTVLVSTGFGAQHGLKAQSLYLMNMNIPCMSNANVVPQFPL